ncbi:MAG: hypothetical protein PUE08_07155 [Eubacteriales bacterium]|nr:hypothetical protein [Eubacteriales bacterium]
MVNDENSIYTVFEKIVGYNDFYSFGFSNFQGILLIFILALPIMNYYEKNLSKTSIFIFTRGNSKFKYFAEKFVFLGLYCLISALLFLIFKLLFSGYREISADFVLCFFVFYLTLLTFSCGVCTLSIFIGSVNSYLVFVLIYCVLTLGVTITYYKYNPVFMVVFILLNPVARYMLSWYNGYFEMMNDRETQLMEPLVSVVYNIILLAAWAVALYFLLRNFDISLKQYDEE